MTGSNIQAVKFNSVECQAWLQSGTTKVGINEREGCNMIAEEWRRGAVVKLYVLSGITVLPSTQQYSVSPVGVSQCALYEHTFVFIHKNTHVCSYIQYVGMHMCTFPLTHTCVFITYSMWAFICAHFLQAAEHKLESCFDSEAELRGITLSLCVRDRS